MFLILKRTLLKRHQSYLINSINYVGKEHGGENTIFVEGFTRSNSNQKNITSTNSKPTKKNNSQDNYIISYENLLAHFWNCHDPTQLNRQGPDVGRQYRSAIFYYSDNQKYLAELSKKEKQNDFNNMIVTEIVEAQTFYLAEEYHQQFLKKRV